MRPDEEPAANGDLIYSPWFPRVGDDASKTLKLPTQPPSDGTPERATSDPGDGARETEAESGS